ncbi:MAG: hypothetical protein HC887_03780 [Desulfobacteraceae bacterium]|nr:hypothetical protein [Desulfobacteraceae bacterium]
MWRKISMMLVIIGFTGIWGCTGVTFFPKSGSSSAIKSEPLPPAKSQPMPEVSASSDKKSPAHRRNRFGKTRVADSETGCSAIDG